MLEVVEQQQERLPRKLRRELLLRAERGTDAGQHELRLVHGRKAHPPDTVVELIDELGRDVESEARLADAAGAGDGDGPRSVAQQPQNVDRLLLAPDERLGGLRQVAV